MYFKSSTADIVHAFYGNVFACNFARARRTSCTCFHVCVASVSLAEDRVVLFCRHITSIPFFFLVSHLGRFLQCGFWEEGDTPCYSSVCGSGCTACACSPPALLSHSLEVAWCTGAREMSEVLPPRVNVITGVCLAQ